MQYATKTTSQELLRLVATRVGGALRHRHRLKNGDFPAVIEISLYFSPLEKLLSLERTKKKEFSFGSLLAYS